MGRKKNSEQVSVEIIIKGEVPEKIKPFVYYQHYSKITVSSKYVRKINIPMKNNNTLELDLVNSVGEVVDVSQALLPRSHIIASKIELNEDEEKRDFKALNKGETRPIKGKLILYNLNLMDNQDNMREKLTERFNARVDRLKDSNKEKLKDLEEDYKETIADQKNTINALSIIIRHLNQEKILDPAITNTILATQMSASIVLAAQNDSIVSPDLKAVLPGLLEKLNISGNGAGKEENKLNPERIPDKD
ncbi:MAG: hypothetical protein ACFFDB_00210 [Promethearchaeota archaeon]